MPHLKKWNFKSSEPGPRYDHILKAPKVILLGSQVEKLDQPTGA